MKDSSNWILIADSSRATLLETDKNLAGWRVLLELEHPESRLKGSALTSGDHGRTSPRNRDSTRRAAVAPKTPPKEVEINKFSRELAEILRLGHDRNEYDTAILVAPPEFLGLLRAAITSTVQATIRTEVGKNLTHDRPESVVEMLRTSAPAA
jgi:protein required for attachment to host cells